MLVVYIILIMLLSLSIIPCQLFFIKKLKGINENKTKHKLVFFLINIITVLVIAFSYINFQNAILINQLHLDINIMTNGGIVTTMVAIFLLNCLLNIFIIKIYIKKISKSSEIELIGKE